MYYGSSGGAAYGGLATSFQSQVGFDSANDMESRASWGNHAPNYQGQQTQGVGSYNSQSTIVTAADIADIGRGAAVKGMCFRGTSVPDLFAEVTGGLIVQ